MLSKYYSGSAVRAILFGILFGSVGITGAQTDYPQRPIRVIVAYSPGAGVDLMARVVAQKLTDVFGQQVVVENRAGANGLVGAQAVARSAPDGYTMLVIDRGALTINPILHKALPYDPLKDFAYTGVITELRYVLAISAKVPVTTFQEFVQLAKSKASALNYASVGSGSIIHLNFEQLNTHFGMKLTHVPYKGSNAASAAVISGESSIMMSSWTGVASLVRDGRLRALAYGGQHRSPRFPDVPTVIEAGGTIDTVTPGYFTFALPVGTPDPVMARLIKELGKTVQLPDVGERLANAGLDPIVMTPAAFLESVRTDIGRFGKMVKTLGVEVQ